MTRNKTSCFWNSAETESILRIFSYCDSERDLLSIAWTCKNFQQLAFCSDADSLWTSKAFKVCMNDQCWCGRPSYDRKSEGTIFAYLDVELCCSVKLFCKYLLTASKSNRNYRKMYFSFASSSFENCNEIMKSLGSVERGSFPRLTSLTINSTELTKLNFESANVLLQVLGKSLTSLNMFPSSPRGALSILHTSSPNLRYLRLDSICHYDVNLPYFNNNLEEIMFSYPPTEFQYRGELRLQNLKKFSMSGMTDDFASCNARLSVLPEGLEHLDIGDSATCGSNEVLLSISTRFHRLKHLVINSGDKAHILFNRTFAAFVEGCPLLETLDLSGALVIFDDGALEILCSLKHLHTLNIPYSARYIPSIRFLLSTNSSRIKQIGFRLLAKEEKVEAALHVLDLKRRFLAVTFIVDV